MKKFLAIGLFSLLAGCCLLSVRPATAASLTNYEAVDVLSKGTAVMQRWSSKFCTVWKAQEKVFVTAGHCRSSVNTSVQIKQSGKYDYTYIKSISLPISSQKGGGKDEDWMVLHTEDVMDDMVALPIGCGDELKMGEPVAIGHYPAGLDFSVSFGHIMTLDVDNNRSNAVIATDAAAAPGSSGAPVISMETGRVIGMVIEGIVSRFGAFAVGLESVENLDLCENLVKEDEREVINDTF